MSILDLSSFDKRGKIRYGALGYLRVSDPSQAERENSLKQQRREIEDHFERKLGIPILDWFVDEGKSAHKDHENRDGFWRMIERAKQDTRVGFIAVDEESRFFRDRYRTAAVKGELLEYGVRCLTAKRDADPTTIAGLWMESIEETMAHAHSLANRDYTLRGMAGNIHARDPETGWAFKNGGAPPFGWKAKRVDLGRDSKGRPIIRTVWLLDEEKAKIRRRILMWRKERWNYEQIRDELNANGIPAPRHPLWSTSTIQTFCREDNVWTAAGYGIWNKHHRKKKPIGQKFKPIDDWEIEENAHPAIITLEEAEAIIAVGRELRSEWTHTRGNQRRSDYLLSGNNLDNEPLFICAACGGRMTGNRRTSRNRKKYLCSTYDRKGPAGCVPVRVDKEDIETTVLQYIRDHLFTEAYVREVLRAANAAIMAEQEKQSELPEESQLKEARRKLENIKKAIMNGTSEEIWAEELSFLHAEVKRLESVVATKKTEKRSYRMVDESQAPTIVNRLLDSMASVDIDDRRRFVRSFVRQIALDPKRTRVTVEFLPNPQSPLHPVMLSLGVDPSGHTSGADMVPPRGFVIDPTYLTFTLEELAAIRLGQL